MNCTDKELDELLKYFKDAGHFKITKDDLVECLAHELYSTLKIPYEDLPLYMNVPTDGARFWPLAITLNNIFIKWRLKIGK